ncbi:MAG: metallophosphoesterase family protein [Planctomycetes bacterium]|nr:metallophosphoesterase family protein [Planctomycetota bacterium]
MTQPREPVTILSDLHLGARSNWPARINRMRKLWAGSKTVVFNGDTLSPSLSRNEQTRRRVIAHINDTCQAEGAQAILIGGNSDHEITHPRHLFLAGGAVAVMHGDAIFDDCSPWRLDARKLGAARAEALAGMSEERRGTLEGRLDSALLALQKTFAKDTQRGRYAPGIFRLTLLRINWLMHWRSVLAVPMSWYRLPGLADAFLSRYASQAHVLVIGHSHRAGVWRFGRRTVINTGSFNKPAHPLIVRVAGGELTVRTVKTRKHCQLPGGLVTSLALGEGQDNHPAANQPRGSLT